MEHTLNTPPNSLQTLPGLPYITLNTRAVGRPHLREVRKSRAEASDLGEVGHVAIRRFQDRGQDLGKHGEREVGNGRKKEKKRGGEDGKNKETEIEDDAEEERQLRRAERNPAARLPGRLRVELQHRAAAAREGVEERLEELLQPLEGLLRLRVRVHQPLQRLKLSPFPLKLLR